MKKKINILIISVAFFAIISLNLKLNSGNNNMSDFTLANIEALAQGESGDSGGKLGCYQTVRYHGDDWGPFALELPYCGTCTSIRAHDASDSHYCTPK